MTIRSCANLENDVDYCKFDDWFICAYRSSVDIWLRLKNKISWIPCALAYVISLLIVIKFSCVTMEIGVTCVGLLECCFTLMIVDDVFSLVSMVSYLIINTLLLFH
jgi:hypothetical protein